MNNLNGIRAEIFSNVGSFLDARDCQNLRQVSKDTKQRVEKDKTFLQIIKDRFSEVFGFITANENDSLDLINSVANKTDSIKSLKILKERINGVKHICSDDGEVILQFVDGKFKLINKESYFKEDDSWWETLKKKYSLFRGAPSVTDDEVVKLFENHLKIFQEVNATTNAIGQPLKTLKNRFRRLKTIVKERKKIIEALQVSSKINLSLIEKIVFTIISFFHSLVCSSLNNKLEKLVLNTSLTDLPKWHTSNFMVKIGEKNIELYNRMVPIDIEIDCDNATLYITQLDTISPLANLRMKFKPANDNNKFPVLNCTIADIPNDLSTEDTSSLCKVCSQIALEIAENENVSGVEVFLNEKAILSVDKANTLNCNRTKYTDNLLIGHTAYVESDTMECDLVWEDKIRLERILNSSFKFM